MNHDYGLLDEAERTLDLALIKDWLNHPVTRVLGVVLAAEIAYQVIIRLGVKAIRRSEQ